MKKESRITFWIEENIHKKLKAKLALKGLTISKFLRLKIKEYLDK